MLMIKDNTQEVVIPLRNVLHYDIVEDNCDSVILERSTPNYPTNELIRFIDKRIEPDSGIPKTFFRSEAEFYIFVLNYISGKERCKLLDIREELYHNKEKADEWKNRIFTRINPRYCKIIGAKEACEKLIWFYKHMTDED